MVVMAVADVVPAGAEDDDGADVELEDGMDRGRCGDLDLSAEDERNRGPCPYGTDAGLEEEVRIGMPMPNAGPTICIVPR